MLQIKFMHAWSALFTQTSHIASWKKLNKCIVVELIITIDLWAFGINPLFELFKVDIGSIQPSNYLKNKSNIFSLFLDSGIEPLLHTPLTTSLL